MKSIIKPLFFAFAALCLSVSCLNTSQYDGNDPNYADGHEIVTIVDGSYDVPYYVLFDNGRKAFVAQNSVASSITFPQEPEQMKGERRMAIDYNIVNEARKDYDLSIKIVGMQDVQTDLLDDVNSDKLAGKVSTHTAPITVADATFSSQLNYITLRMIIMRSDQSQFNHSVFLAHNKLRTGAYKEIYDSYPDVDSYLWLELYHDSDTDYEQNAEEIYASYKIDTEHLGIEDMSKYKGINIISKNYDSKKPTFFTIGIN